MLNTNAKHFIWEALAIYNILLQSSMFWQHAFLPVYFCIATKFGLLIGMSHFSKYRLLKSLLSSFQNRYPFSRRWILFSVFSAHDSSPLAAYDIIQTARSYRKQA